MLTHHIFTPYNLTYSSIRVIVEKQNTTMSYSHQFRFEMETDVEWLHHVIARKTTQFGDEMAEVWLRDYIQNLQKKYDHTEVHWSDMLKTLMKTIEEVQVFPNRFYDEDPSLCPYCPRCADEANHDVVDYPYRRYPYCEQHNPEGVKPKKSFDET